MPSAWEDIGKFFGMVKKKKSPIAERNERLNQEMVEADEEPAYKELDEDEPATRVIKKKPTRFKKK